MAQTTVYANDYFVIKTDDIVDKLRSLGWGILLFRGMDDLRPYLRINIEDPYIVGFKLNDYDPELITREINANGRTGVKKLINEGIIGDIIFSIRHQYDYHAEYFSNFGPDAWEHEKKVVPPDILEFLYNCKICYELSDWDYGVQRKQSKELISLLSSILSEITGGLIEDDDTSTFIFNNHNYKRLPIEKDYKNCSLCGSTMRQNDDYGTDSSGQKIDILCSGCINNGVPTSQFQKRIDSWYNLFKESKFGDKVQKVIDDISFLQKKDNN